MLTVARTFNVAVIDGGRTGAFWGYLFVWVGYTAVIASLSELVSMIPTAAGQYHWVFELSPPKYRKFLSWFTGWQIFLAWQADFAAVLYLCGILIQAMAALNYPDYDAQRYHATLILWAVIVASVLFNTTLARLLPWVEGSILICHCLGFIVVLVPIVYFGPHVPAKDVWNQFVSSGGYSDGTAFFV
jgi:choline transport protein